MIILNHRQFECPHCHMEADLRMIQTHGGIRYDVHCQYCGNSTDQKRTAHDARSAFKNKDPHFHKIGMGYFLNHEEGQAYVYRPITLETHRSCMEIMQEGYEGMIVRFDYCPDCGAHITPLIDALSTRFPIEGKV